MPPNLRKLVIVAGFIALCGTAVVVITTRASRSDVDSSLAGIRESHTCPHCGHAFMLSIDEARAMRRSQGDIVCPKCGKAGAFKDAAMVGTELVRDAAPPDEDQEDEDSESSPGARKKPTAPSATLTRQAPP